MTKLAIFTLKEQQAFDAPPKFHKIDRPRYFSISREIKRSSFNKLRTDINRVGFILQLGYFRASGKFFVAEDFRKRDIQYICKMLEINKLIFNFTVKRHVNITGIPYYRFLAGSYPMNLTIKN